MKAARSIPLFLIRKRSNLKKLSRREASKNYCITHRKAFSIVLRKQFLPELSKTSSTYFSHIEKFSHLFEGIKKIQILKYGEGEGCSIITHSAVTPRITSWICHCLEQTYSNYPEWSSNTPISVRPSHKCSVNRRIRRLNRHSFKWSE